MLNGTLRSAASNPRASPASSPGRPHHLIDSHLLDRIRRCYFPSPGAPGYGGPGMRASDEAAEPPCLVAIWPVGLDGEEEMTGGDHGQGNAVGTQRRHLGTTMKQPLLQSASAVERLRIWLLKQAWIHSVLLPALPRQVRWILRKVYLAPVDLADRLTGRRDPGLPPKAQIFTGMPLDFAASATRTLETLRSIADVNPSSRSVAVSAVSLSRCRISSMQTVVMRASTSFLKVSSGANSTSWVPMTTYTSRSPTSTIRNIIRRAARSQLIINFLMRTRPSTSSYLYRCSRTCCQLTLTDMSVRSRGAQKERADLRKLLHYHARIAPADDFKSRLQEFQTRPRVTPDPQQEGPRARRRLRRALLPRNLLQAWTV